MINIVIADDMEIIRNGLKTIIEQNKEINVCGLAKNGSEAVELCKKLNPDLVLMDMRMPVCSGEQATKTIKEQFPHIKVLVLTTFDDKETVNQALASGADGYILKNVDEEKIVNAIHSTLSGINVFGSTVFNSIRSTIMSAPKPQISLTNRERQLLVLIAQGYSNKEIAEKMFLSDGTVRNNISALLLKLNLKDRTQLAVFAVKNNFV